jgi:hypothetical protein
MQVIIRALSYSSLALLDFIGDEEGKRVFRLIFKGALPPLLLDGVAFVEHKEL